MLKFYSSITHGSMKGMRRKVVIFIFVIDCLTYSAHSYAQSAHTLTAAKAEASLARLMFYNAENLFDIQDDSLTNDEEFLPAGIRYWTYRKLEQKLTHLYKTIVAVGTWQPPAIVGLCEIENKYVLQRLVEDTPLQQLQYQIIHYDSPDKRGIDVALLYREPDFIPMAHEAIRIHFPHNSHKTTRDILYTKGILLQTDTVHLFINHWPSRWGGQQASAPARNHVADVLHKKVDSLFTANSQANIIIMGDFNDAPEDPSLQSHLGAKLSIEEKETALYNMMGTKDTASQGIVGTHKYQGQWHMFDQIIVSGALLQENRRLRIPGKRAQIFNADFLLQDDLTYMGKKPFRTYTGYQYQGGFSDHLPVFIDLTTLPFPLTHKGE